MILDTNILKTKLEDLLKRRISLPSFKEWSLEVITTDDWIISESAEGLLKEIIFTFDDDSIKWDEQLAQAIAKVALECLNNADVEAGRNLFSKEASRLILEERR